MSAKFRRKMENLPVRLILWRPAIQDPVNATFADIRDKWTLRELTEAHILCDVHGEISKAKMDEAKSQHSRGAKL